jgi:hypothetical protein
VGRRRGIAIAGRFIGLLLAAASIAYARPRLLAKSHGEKASDVLTLPPPGLLIALSLGYRSALADWIYTSTIVSYGIHAEERRRFEYVGKYLESIVALDARFCQTYRYADTFIIFQAVGTPTPDDVRTARRLIEQGLVNCAYDGQLWLSAGQFMAFIATQFLTDAKEVDEFRARGAVVLARAAELSTQNQNAQWQTLAAAGIFTKEGNREAAISFLERVYAVTDDEELKANVAQKLALLRREGTVDRAQRRARAFNEMWGRELPFVSRTELLVVGPPYDPTACAGGAPPRRCAESWAAWAKAQPLDGN